MSHVSPRRAVPALIVALLASFAMVLAAGGAPAHAASAWWLMKSTAAPHNATPGNRVIIYAQATDLGYTNVSGAVSPVILTDKVPVGLKVLIVSAEAGVYTLIREKVFEPIILHCTTEAQTYSCPLEKEVRPTESVRIRVEAEVEPGVELGSTLTNEMSIKGGRTPNGDEPPPNIVKDEIPITTEPVKFGDERFEMRAENKDGTLDTQAGSHPFQLTTTFDLNKTLEPTVTFGQKTFLPFLPAPPRDFHFVLPPGMVGAISKVPQCSGTDFVAVVNGQNNGCEPNTAIGFANAMIDEPLNLGPFTQNVPIFNLVPTPGEPARFGFIAHTVPVVLTTHVRSGSDYAVEVSVHYLPESIEILSTEATFWGVPGAAEHDSARSWACLGGGYLEEQGRKCEPIKDEHPQAFLTLPTSCGGTPTATVNALAYNKPEREFTDSFQFAPFKGCEALPFTPSVEVETDKHEAATPTGMTVKVKLPQETTLSGEPGALGESAVKATTLTLPAGIQASGGAALGLATCTSSAFGFNGGEALGEPPVEALAENDHFNEAAVQCPDAAKIGTVTIKSPLIEEGLTGSVYLAAKDTNPFGSPLVLYIYAEAPVSKVQVKLAGEVKIDPQTGQLTSVFNHTPPVAFSELNLHLFDGPRASQSTPEQCGSYSATASFEGWSGQTVAAESPAFVINKGAKGAPCAAANTQPFEPTIEAGSENGAAGAFSPLVLNVKRPDGSQALKTITVHAPEGAAAILASVTPCPTAVATAPEPNCPESSKIGVSTAIAGLGSDHVTIPGDVYLTGPYKGAPFGVLALSNAEHIGPFNLGKIPVMSTITVNETTGAATFTSDPLPERVKGVPSQINSLHIVANRPKFTFNPTNCAALAYNSVLTGYGPNGTEGVSTSSNPFHAEGCAALPFTPTLEVSVESKASRSTGTGLVITVKSSPGQANIGKTKLEFPKAIPSRLETLKKSCRDTVFNVNPANCSPDSIVGTAIAHTPVLKSPLTGPVYLVSHGSAAFPDAEILLQGEGIKLTLDGTTDITKEGVTVSSFEAVPDAPVESFVVTLPSSTKSAFTVIDPKTNEVATNPAGVCSQNLLMPTRFTGQNGKVLVESTKISVTGCDGVKKFKKAKPTELQKNLKLCAKLKKSKRAKCVASAHRRWNAVQACKKTKKGKRAACEVKARKKNALKL